MTDKKDGIELILRKKKIFRLSDVMSLLNCSIATARRRLKKWGALSSYNKNASYYTLPDVPQFNEHQLWQCRGAHFSKYGTLKKTVEALIEKSDGGLNVIEISKTLGVPAHNILSQQSILDENISREKHRGIYVYYSKSPKTSAVQKEAREKSYHHFDQLELPSDAESVIILVELIKHPEDTAAQLSRRAQYKGLSVAESKTKNLLIYHNLLKKNMG